MVFVILLVLWFVVWRAWKKENVKMTDPVYKHDTVMKIGIQEYL